MMKIKVCGLKESANIAGVTALKPDYMGFICYEQSPRFIGELSLETLSGLPSSICKTGVFINEKAACINELIDKFGFEVIQLHGDERPEFCDAFRPKVTVIKAFGIDKDFNFDNLADYVDNVDFFLFDTKTAIHGGSGATFDWAVLNKYTLDVPFFLSGGLSPDNLEEVKIINHPQLYGVDLNSRFETSPGIKDIEKLTKAFEIIKRSYVNELRS